jgi:opacity protein-like surface antigen
MSAAMSAGRGAARASLIPLLWPLRLPRCGPQRVRGGRTSYSSTDVFFFGCPNCATTSFSNTSSGYVLGGGLEWAPWSSNWIVRGEYLYYNLSGAAGGGFLPGAGFVAANPTWSNMAVSSGRLGLSYKF